MHMAGALDLPARDVIECDRLGASDLAIVEFRRRMIQAVRDFQAGRLA